MNRTIIKNPHRNLASRGQPGVIVIPPEEFFTDHDHGLNRRWLVAKPTCGAIGISMAVGILPPGRKGTMHVHPFNTAILSLSGTVIAAFETADGIQEIEAPEGFGIYIPGGVPHMPINPGTVNYKYVVARPSGDPD